jgi:hypothetical protein
VRYLASTAIGCFTDALDVNEIILPVIKRLALEDLQGLAPRSRYLPSNARRFFRPRSKPAHCSAVQMHLDLNISAVTVNNFDRSVFSNLQRNKSKSVHSPDIVNFVHLWQ